MESPTLSACLIQNSSPCKNTLQASPNDSFSVIAKISPAYLEDSLHFSWKANGKILASNAQFKTDTSRVPDTLVVQDSYGNSLSFPLSFVFRKGTSQKGKNPYHINISKNIHKRTVHF